MPFIVIPLTVVGAWGLLALLTWLWSRNKDPRKLHLRDSDDAPGGY